MANEDIFSWGSSQYSHDRDMYLHYMQYSVRELRKLIKDKFNVQLGYGVRFARHRLKNFIKARYEDYEDDPDGFLEEHKDEINKVYDVVSALHLLRNCAWDLWAAVPEVCSYVFPNTDLTGDIYEETGLLCALLRKFNYVYDEEPFTDFDT